MLVSVGCGKHQVSFVKRAQCLNRFSLYLHFTMSQTYQERNKNQNLCAALSNNFLIMIDGVLKFTEIHLAKEFLEFVFENGFFLLFKFYWHYLLFITFAKNEPI